MRSNVDIRKYFLSLLQHSLRRPSMFVGPSVFYAEGKYLDYLGALDFIDERDQKDECDYQTYFEQRSLFSSRKVTGRIEMLCEGIYSNDEQVAILASYVAEFAYHHGYLSIERALSIAAWGKLKKGLKKKLKKGKWQQADVEELCGKPSFIINPMTYAPVYCYAIEDEASGAHPWLYFDFMQHKQTPYVRTARLPSKNPADGLVLVKYKKNK